MSTEVPYQGDQEATRIGADFLGIYGIEGNTLGKPNPSHSIIPKPFQSWPDGPTEGIPISGSNPEVKKGIEKAALGIHLDRVAIKNILNDHPEILPRHGMDFGIEENETIYAQRREELQKVLDSISSLPEDLVFEPGITLIVGENGTGKSTFERAIQLRVLLESRYQEGLGRDLSFAEFMQRQLDPEKFSLTNSPNEPTPSPLSILLVPHISLSSFESQADHFYLDAPVISGYKDSLGKDIVEMDMTYGGSHGQTSQGALEHLEDRKAEYNNAVSRKILPTLGPGVIFMDEIETGLSPQNHRKLPGRIGDALIEGSIALFATNSVVMYDTDLPRIDLSNPQLGIHKPSEHSEIYLDK